MRNSTQRFLTAALIGLISVLNFGLGNPTGGWIVLGIGAALAALGAAALVSERKAGQEKKG